MAQPLTSSVTTDDTTLKMQIGEAAKRPIRCCSYIWNISGIFRGMGSLAVSVEKTECCRLSVSKKIIAKRSNCS